VQVPKSHDPDDAIAHPQRGVNVVDVFLFLPHDGGHVERDAVRVDDDAEHAVAHAQQQRKLEQAVDARKQICARAVHRAQVADVGGAERGYAEPRRAAVTGPRRRPALPPRVLGLVHQRLDVPVQNAEPQVQRNAREVEKLLDYDARDVRQRREQANNFGPFHVPKPKKHHKQRTKLCCRRSCSLRFLNGAVPAMRIQSAETPPWCDLRLQPSNRNL